MSQPEKPPAGLKGKITSLLKSRLLRAAVSILLLGLLLLNLNLQDLKTAFSNISPGLVVLALSLYLGASLTCVYKWRLILKVQGVTAPYFYLLSLFYIGFFFSNFLPTNFGGDVVKIYKLSRTTGRPVEAASSVVADRVSSTFALLLIAVVPAVTQLSLLGAKMTALILALFFMSLLIIGLLANADIARRLGNIPVLKVNPFGARKYLADFYFSLNQFRHHRSTLAILLAISVFYQMLQIVAVYFLALSLGIDLSLLYYFIFIPILQAVSMIPVSINGLGVREGSWVLLFARAGVPSAEAFSMSILSLMVMTATSLLGGVFYLFDRTTTASEYDVGHE